MDNRRKKTSLLVVCLFLSFAAGTIVASAAETTTSSEQGITVAADGNGDYNCDGIADQVEINEALQYAKNNNIDTVYLQSGSYTIDNSIKIPDEMTLTGDPDVTVKLIEDWPVTRDEMFTPMITGTTSASAYITISGFTLDGNKYNQYYISNLGGGRSSGEIDSFPAIQFSYSEHITIKDMVIRDIPGDGIRLNGGKNRNIVNNTIHDTGHDDIFIKNGNYDVIDGNTLSRLAHDSGIRLDDSANMRVTNNTLSTDKDALFGTSGIYLLKHGGDEHESYNTTIAYNTIYSPREMGIALAIGEDANNLPVTSARDVHIHHNIISGAGTNYRTGYPYGGGIWLDGWSNTTIENNVIDGSMGDGIAYSQRFSNTQSATYTTIVRNNIITNTADSPVLTSDGNGISNRLGQNYKFVLENNIVWNSTNENYNNVGSHDNDINADPLFADVTNNDYHLQSAAGRWSADGWTSDTETSPAIDAGDSASDYTNESGTNGNVINIGRYGNTAEASRSVSDSTSDNASDKPASPDENRAPVINLFKPADAAEFEEGSTVNISVGAVDAEGDTLNYTIAIDGSQVSTSATYQWHLNDSSPGSHVIEVTVSDGVNSVNSSHTILIADK